MGKGRIRYRIGYRFEDEVGMHRSGTKSAGTLWGAVTEINALFELGAQITYVEKERWSEEPLDRQERDTIEMLTHGRVKL